MRISDRRRLLTVLIIALFGGAIGITYSYVLTDTSADPWTVADTRLAGLSGFTVAGFAALFELMWYQAPRGRWLRRKPVLVAFAGRVAILTLLVVLALVINREIHLALGGDDPHSLPRNRLLRDVAFSFLVTAAFIFVMQTTALVGGRTLGNFLLGRYYRPVEEERIFLFLDMKGSTDLVRRLGNARFHAFLSDAFFVMDAAIVEHGGEIVAYVGDSVIATWPMDGRESNARVLLAARDVFARLRLESGRLEGMYGATPEFRAVAHGGPVVVGECGDSRRQITYLGDVLNVTARLEEVAKTRGINMAIAGPLFDQIDLPSGFSAVPLGALRLRGVAEPVNVYEVLMA